MSLFARLFPDRAPAAMPQPHEPEWSHAWARRWLLWLGQQLDDEESGYAPGPELVPATMLALVAELLAAGRLELIIERDECAGPPDDEPPACTAAAWRADPRAVCIEEELTTWCPPVTAGEALLWVRIKPPD